MISAARSLSSLTTRWYRPRSVGRVSMDPARPATMQEGWQSPLLDALEQQPWLDKAGNYLTELLQPLLDLPEARPIKDFLHGTWLGHSLHPVLTDLPIGFWSGICGQPAAVTAGPEKSTPLLDEWDPVDGAPRKVEVEGRAVLLYREGPRVFAMEHACAHAGGPLDEAEARDGVVTCPWHGSQFRLRDGALVRGPSTFSQLRLQARIAKGQVEV